MEEAERLCDRVAILDHGRIIDMDSPEGLVRRHCPERTVVLATDEPAAADHFRRLAGVTAVTATNGRLTIQGSGEDLVMQVIRCLSAEQIHVTDFRTVLPTLEDVFLKVTGHSIRD
jgi:ABC-2 type transport system ATP-binding protein